MMALISVRAAAFVTFGAILGFAYLAALELYVRLYLDSGSGWAAPLAHTVRVLTIIAAFTLCAHRGALALVSSVAGFHLVKIATVGRRCLEFAGKS